MYVDARTWRQNGHAERYVRRASLLLPTTAVALLTRNSWGETRKLSDQLSVVKRYAREHALPVVYEMEPYTGRGYYWKWELHLSRESAKAVQAGAEAVLSEAPFRYWRSRRFGCKWRTLPNGKRVQRTKGDKLAQPQEYEWRWVRFLLGPLVPYAIHSASEEHRALTMRMGTQGRPAKPKRPERYGLRYSDDEAFEELRELLADDKGIREAARIIGRSESTCRGWIAQF